MATNFSHVFFNKSLNNLTYQDISDYFIEAKEESTKIEFKSYAGEHGNFNQKLDGIIRAICAMLNSEGGIVIWGAPSGIIPEGQNSKVFQGELSPVNELKEKDWLINKVSDLITPLPIGIDLAILQNGENVIYVFEVQQSSYSPHAFAKIYYARLDGQTKPAPHYLIEALFRKIKYPNLEGYIKLDQISNNVQHYILDISILIFNFTHLQNEEQVTFRLMSPNGIFARSVDPNFAEYYSHNGHELIFQNHIDILHYGQPVVHQERLIFNPFEIAERNYMVDLLLSFSGKFSPLKTSDYVLNLHAINWYQPNVPNYLIHHMEENVLSFDKQNALGTTRESVLTQFLGR